MLTAVRIVFALILLLVSTAAAAEPLRGVWVASANESEPLWLSLSHRSPQSGRSMNSFTIDPAELTGLDPLVIDARETTQVRFQLRREAGVLSFQGHFTEGEGSGHFTYQPSEAFARKVRELGFGSATLRELFAMAVHDVTETSIRSLQGLGFESFDRNDLLAFAIHRVSAEYVRSLRALGFSIHGVTARWVRDLREQGIGSTDSKVLIKAKIHGVDRILARRR